MKNIVKILLVTCICCGCEYLPERLTEKEVVDGLKLALKIGAEEATVEAKAPNGFWDNKTLPEIRIPLPNDVQNVVEAFKEVQVPPLLIYLIPALDIDKLVSDFVKAMNTAASKAAEGALPIFVDAILGMSISDGFKILNDGGTAATDYLREKTTDDLRTAFFVVVEKVMEDVPVTEYWDDLRDSYNGALSAAKVIPFVSGYFSNVSEIEEQNFEMYITERAIDGLMKLIEVQELKIRDNPFGRGSDLLEKVFGKRN